MPQEQAVVLAIKILFGAAALYGGYRTVRRVVHFFDAFETMVANTSVAVDLVIHEFAANGGRVEHPIVSETDAMKATIKDLMLDTRTLLHGIANNQHSHATDAEARTARLMNEIARIERAT